MPSVIDVASYILELSKETAEDGEFELISHMKLQKLVYYCQGFHLALHGTPFFPESIEAWTHGPVCPRLYKMLKNYGSSPIAVITDLEKISLTPQEKNLISMVYCSYGQYSAYRLREMTHKAGPWKETQEGRKIDNGVILCYFRSLLEVDPRDIPYSTPEKQTEILNILEEAEANGEIDLSQFCEPVGNSSYRGLS